VRERERTSKCARIVLKRESEGWERRRSTVNYGMGEGSTDEDDWGSNMNRGEGLFFWAGLEIFVGVEFEVVTFSEFCRVSRVI
jgi:hypothetical protein